MQYSYERWLNKPPEEDIESVAGNEPEQVPHEAVTDRSSQNFPFAEDLKVLEQNLSLGFDEGVRVYRQHQSQPQAGLGRSETALSAEEAHWEDLAKLVADHVLAYMLDNPLQNELQDLRRQNSFYYKDNLLMTEQVRKLADENDGLRKALSQIEKELASFHQVAGGFYIKR